MAFINKLDIRGFNYLLEIRSFFISTRFALLLTAIEHVLEIIVSFSVKELIRSGWPIEVLEMLDISFNPFIRFIMNAGNYITWINWREWKGLISNLNSTMRKISQNRHNFIYLIDSFKQPLFIAFLLCTTFIFSTHPKRLLTEKINFHG